MPPKRKWEESAKAQPVSSDGQCQQRPDLEEISVTLTDLAGDIRRFRGSTDPSTGEQKILTAVEELRSEITSLRTYTEAGLECLKTLTRKITTMEQNNRARTKNKEMVERDHMAALLGPLRSLKTGNKIPDFPDTASAARGLNIPKKAVILAELEVETASSYFDIMRNFNVAIRIPLGF